MLFWSESHHRTLRHRRKSIVVARIVATCCVLLVHTSLHAQAIDGEPTPLVWSDEPAVVEHPGPPTITIERTTDIPIIDGRLDDAIWQTSAQITEFVQQRPVEGAPPTEDTEVYLAYDSEQLYFGIYAHYSDTRLIRANRVARDQIGRDDVVDIYFDPFRDAQRAYVFSVNSYGVQGDRLMSGDGRGGGGGNGGGGGGGRGNDGDTSWDALFASAGRMVEDGWTAELAIPFKSLRYPAQRPGEQSSWGFQIERTIEGLNESIVWAPVSRAIPGFLTQMGLLGGMTGLSTSRNIEVLPTFTAVRDSRLDTESGNQVTSSNPSGGINLKYGFTPTLVLDFTFNPDFSQIESDRQQIEVNQRFPVFYPELRPFFLEGQEIFDVRGPATFVHTRTIVDPQYGVKLTGKIGKTAVALLAADDTALGNVDDTADPAYGASAHVVLGRVRHDFYQESSIGGVFTDREFLTSHSRLGGVDGSFRFGGIYRFSFGAIFSDRRDLDDTRQSGHSLSAALNAQGRNLSYSISHDAVAPGFGTDLGFVRRVDLRRTNARIQYRWYPEDWIANWGPRLEYERTFDYAGVKQDGGLTAGLNVQFARNIMLNVNVNRSMERYQAIDFEKTRFSFFGNVNAMRRISFGGGYNNGDQIRFVDDPYLGRNSATNLFANVRPISRLQVQLNLDRSRFTDVRSGSQSEVFDIKILRAQTSFQFTDRLTLRSILEHNTYDRTAGANFLVTYRVNAGTVFYAGYDSRYRQGDHLQDTPFPTRAYQRTGRAIFTKVQYLMRY